MKNVFHTGGSKPKTPRQAKQVRRKKSVKTGVSDTERGRYMVKVARLQGKEFFVNPDMIEFIEETPDLVVSLISGKKIIVEGTAEELIDRIVAYRLRTHSQTPDIIGTCFDEDESDDEA